MTPCKRGCCWTPMAGVCARSRECDCHWGDWLTPQTPDTGRTISHRDPTGNEAVARAMRGKRKGQ